MSGGFGRFDASALIDGHIHDHRTRHHGFEHFAGDQVRRFRSWNQNGANHEIHRLDVFADVAR